MVEAMLQANDILPRHILRIDVTTGGDHGKGAFQQGIRLTLVVKDEVELKNPDDDDEKAVTVDSIVAEVICKKDNAKVLELTINSQLFEALSEIADGKLEIHQPCRERQNAQSSHRPGRHITWQFGSTCTWCPTWHSMKQSLEGRA